MCESVISMIIIIIIGDVWRVVWVNNNNSWLILSLKLLKLFNSQSQSFDVSMNRKL